MLKHGGPKLFRRARPFFLGLILGQFSIAGLWLIIEFLRALRIMWVFGSEKGVHMPDWALRFALGCTLVWAAPVAAAVDFVELAQTAPVDGADRVRECVG